MTQHILVICGSCQRLGFRVWTVHRTFEPRTDVTEHTHILNTPNLICCELLQQLLEI